MSTALTEETTTEAPLDDRLAVACGHLNACFALLVSLVGDVIARQAWRGHGIRSVEHWITWRTGLSAAHAHSLVALAGATDSHPHVTAAFQSGQLSIDQAALAIRARPCHDATVADWAKVMTLAQLRLAVRASDISAPPPGPEPSDDDNNNTNEPGGDGEPEPEPVTPREHLSLRPDEDGTWPLHGRLDADHGALVDAALTEARDRLYREGHRDVTWVDALVDIARRSLDAAPLERRERFRINLFLDPARSPHATWTNGIAVPDAITRLCTCDGTLSPVFVAEGRPVSVGRSQRIVPERARRLVLQRDKQCRNPLCSATRGLEVHHIIHWIDGGPTDTWNLIALCARCHRDHHLGRLELGGDADEPGGVTFFDDLGKVIDTATHARPPSGPPPDPLIPYRHPLGERLQRWAVFFNPPPPSDSAN